MENSAKTLLLVEDEAIVGEAQAQSLKKAGYSVLLALRGKEAIEAVRSGLHEIDLVLMDIDLGPGLDGTEVAREILKDYDIPIVFLSSHTEKVIVEKTAEITSYGYVVKDSGISVLLASIDMAFRLHSAYIALKEKEDALAESEIKYRTLVNASPDAISVIGADGRMSFASPEALKMFGLDGPGEAIGRGPLEFVADEDQERAKINIQNLMKGGAVSRNSYTMVRKDKTRIIVENHSSVLTDASGKPRGVIAITRDITERKLIEDKLHESERRYRSMIEHAPFGVTMTAGGNLLFCNQSACAIFGYSFPSEMQGRSMSDFVQAEDLKKLLAIGKKIRKNEIVKGGFRFRGIKADGEGIEVDGIAYKAPFDTGDAIVAFQQAMTDSKLAEERGAKSEQLYRTLVNALSEGIVVTGIDMRVKFLSTQALKLFGFDRPEEILGRSPMELIAPEDRRRAAANIQHFTSNREISENRYSLLRKDGTHFCGEVHSSVIPDASGNPKETISIIRDVTERTRAEEALKESESLLNSIIEQSPYPTWISDDKGVLIRINNACCDMLNLRPEEVIGKYNILRDNIVKEQGVLPLVKGVFSGGEIARFEITYDSSRLKHLKLSARARVILETIIFPIRNAQGRMTNAVIQHMDITERRNSREAMERSVKEKEVLLRELQHRVKNNLNVISSLLGLELEKLSDESSKRVFMDAQSRIRSMSSIYERLNQSSSLDSVQLDLYIKDLADSLLRTYATRAGSVRIITRLIAVQLEIKRAVPLGLILNELISNALKYAYPDRMQGEIHVELSKSNKTVELKVSDKGAGLPKGFDPNAPVTLGLRLVRMLAEQIDGELRIKGGKGTMITVRFSL